MSADPPLVIVRSKHYPSNNAHYATLPGGGPHLAPMHRQYVANRQKEEDEAREKETASVIILASPSIALLTSIANSYIAMHCRNYCCHQGQEPQYPGIQNMCWSKSEMGRLCTQPFYRYWECVENWNGLHPFSLSFPRRSIVIRLRLPIDVGRKEVSGWVMDQDDWSPDPLFKWLRLLLWQMFITKKWLHWGAVLKI